MEKFDIIWLLLVAVVGLLNFAKKASARKNAQSESDGESPEAASTEQSGGGAAVFAYYYTREGQKKVDAVKSAEASGRELDEYEIFSEQQRLDSLWAAELERREALEREMSEQLYDMPREETPSLGEILDNAREKDPDHLAETRLWDAEPVETSRNGDREYQLQQLDRWLEAGLIDKKEYKKRKKEL